MASVRSLYDVLNVSQQAETVVIEAAYRALMKKYHPDQAGDTAGEGSAPVSRDAAEINKAYRVLKDSARRSEYDRRLWTQQQAIRLAELKALEPRRGSRAFVWTGWMMAVLLGCAAAAIAVARDVIRPVSAETLAAAAKAEKARVTPERAAAIKAAASEEVVFHPSSDLVIARVRAETGAPFAVRAEAPARAAPLHASPLRAAAPSVRQRKHRKRAQARPLTPREKADFLEREGYIY